MKLKITSLLLAVALLFGFALPVFAATSLPKTSVEIVSRSVEVPATPMNVSTFVSAYNAILRTGAPEIEASYLSGMVNVPADQQAKPFSATIHLDNAGLVKGYSVAVVPINYDTPGDLPAIYADMLPSVLTGMEVLGIDAAAWSSLQEAEYIQVSKDEYRRQYVGETFICQQYLGYAEWFPGDYRLALMQLSVTLI